MDFTRLFASYTVVVVKLRVGNGVAFKLTVVIDTLDVASNAHVRVLTPNGVLLDSLTSLPLAYEPS